MSGSFIAARTLCMEHVTRMVKVYAPEGPCTGVLVGVGHHADTVSDATIMKPDAVALGRTHTCITLQGWGTREVAGGCLVELLS